MDPEEIVVAPAKPHSAPKRLQQDEISPIIEIDRPATRRGRHSSVKSESNPPSQKSSDGVSSKARNENDSPEFVQPRNHTAQLKNDLVDFGFSSLQIKEMLGWKEALWDPATPQYIAEAVKAAAAQREKREFKKEIPGAEEEMYEPLFFRDDSKWALFDPNKDFPLHFGDPPAFFDELATFQQGNARILEYNINTQSVRIRSTPPSLQGKKIDYTRTGPKIVEVKRGRGRPRKHPLPVNGIVKLNAKKVKPVSRPRNSAVMDEQSDEGDEIVVKMENANNIIGCSW